MLLAVPFIAAGVAEIRASGAGRARRIGRVLGVASAYLLLAIFVKVGGAWRGGGAFDMVDGEIHPVGPVRLMEEQGLQGNLFCNPTSAGYVTWVLHPSRVRVYMDMRTPIVFTAQEIWLYKAVGDTVSLDAFRRRYPVDFLLLDRRSALAESLRDGAELRLRAGVGGSAVSAPRARGAPRGTRGAAAAIAGRPAAARGRPPLRHGGPGIAPGGGVGAARAHVAGKPPRPIRCHPRSARPRTAGGSVVAGPLALRSALEGGCLPVPGRPRRERPGAPRRRRAGVRVGDPTGAGVPPELSCPRRVSSPRGNRRTPPFA